MPRQHACPHLRRQHRGGSGRCMVPSCPCLFGPPPTTRAITPNTAVRTTHRVDANGVVHDFAREGVEPAPAVQTLTIADWHPATSANRSHDHWRKIQKAHHADQTMAWAAAEQAGWRYVQGKVSLTITLVYPRTYHVDADNLAAKCKGLIDGLRLHQDRGFFHDDSIAWLDLKVSAAVRKGVKATEITLTRVSQSDFQQPLPTYNGLLQKTSPSAGCTASGATPREVKP